MICAGFPNGEKNSCHGDSGGPLACFSHGSWKLLGVASKILAPNCEYSPSVYTRVTRCLEWIHEKTGRKLLFYDFPFIIRKI